jgi:hypothetical protein
VAVIVTVVLAVTVLLAIVKVALVEPALIVTLAGTVAALVWLLERVTTAPPLGAALLSVTVPCEEFPPITAVGLSESDESVGVVEPVCGVKLRTADQLPATPAEFFPRTRQNSCAVGRPETVV